MNEAGKIKYKDLSRDELSRAMLEEVYLQFVDPDILVGMLKPRLADETIETLKKERDLYKQYNLFKNNNLK
jgi:hypothetical protein